MNSWLWWIYLCCLSEWKESKQDWQLNCQFFSFVSTATAACYLLFAALPFAGGSGGDGGGGDGG